MYTTDPMTAAETLMLRDLLDKFGNQAATSDHYAQLDIEAIQHTRELVTDNLIPTTVMKNEELRELITTGLEIDKAIVDRATQAAEERGVFELKHIDDSSISFP